MGRAGSWRKPIAFGLSIGVVSPSMARVMTFMPRRRLLGWLLLGTFGTVSFAEVAPITMQKWRPLALQLHHRGGHRLG